MDENLRKMEGSGARSPGTFNHLSRGRVEREGGFTPELSALGFDEDEMRVHVAHQCPELMKKNEH
jgi:hypothetical protein